MFCIIYFKIHLVQVKGVLAEAFLMTMYQAADTHRWKHACGVFNLNSCSSDTVKGKINHFSIHLTICFPRPLKNVASFSEL